MAKKKRVRGTEILAADIGTHVADKGKMLGAYLKGSSKIPLQSTGSMLGGAAAGLAAHELARAGFKAGRSILKGQGVARHRKKILKQETQQAKNKARAAQIKKKKKPLEMFEKK